MNLFIEDFVIFNGTKISLVNFGKTTKILLNRGDVHRSGNAVLNFDKRLRSKQAKLGSALKTTRDQLIGGKQATNTHIIVISDKDIDKEAIDFVREAEDLKENGATIHAVSITDNALYDFQKIITKSAAVKQPHLVQSYADLDKRETLDGLLSSILYGKHNL